MSAIRDADINYKVGTFTTFTSYFFLTKAGQKV